MALLFISHSHTFIDWRDIVFLSLSPSVCHTFMRKYELAYGYGISLYLEWGFFGNSILT